LATLKLVGALSKGNRGPEILHAAELLADLPTTLVAVRREKTSLINRSIGPVRANGGTDRTSEFEGRGKFVAGSSSNPGGVGSIDRDGSSEPASLEFSEGSAIANNLKQLATLDTYEQRTLSRRRKAAFALLLAFEQTVENGG
jgi:hypothetical protein